MTKRLILSTRKMASELGLVSREFLALREDKNFPKPVHGTEHHFLWDSVAVNIYFDKLANINPNPNDYSAIIRQRIAARGNVQSAVSR